MFNGTATDLPKGPGVLQRDLATDTLIRYVEPANPIEQARAAAKAVFASLSLGKQALWESVRAAVDADLVAGKFAEAVERIRTVPVIYPDMETDRAAFLALFAAAH